jgi:hypothetical protein
VLALWCVLCAVLPAQQEVSLPYPADPWASVAVGRVQGFGYLLWVLCVCAAS